MPKRGTYLDPGYVILQVKTIIKTQIEGDDVQILIICTLSFSVYVVGA
jgi:hypothetical protein